MSDGEAIVFAIIVLVIFMIGWAGGAHVNMHGMETQAISRGYALHCPDDGKFAWVGECDEK